LNEVTISDLNILRIMSQAFDGLDTVRVQLVEKGLRIFGIDKASTAYYNMFIQTPSLTDIERGGVTISAASFSSLLELALSGYLTEFEKFSLTIENNSHAIFTIMGKHTELKETLIHVPSGIRTDPPQIKTIDFSKAATCKIKSPKDYRLVYKHFEAIRSFVNNIEPIEIAVVSEGAEFKPFRQIQRLHKLKGKSVGEAESLISLPNIKLTSEVADISGVKLLEIHVLKEALMKFKYTFDSGFLEYIIAPAIAPE